MGEKLPQADRDTDKDSETSGGSVPVSSNDAPPAGPSPRVSKTKGNGVMRGSMKKSGNPRKVSLFQKMKQKETRQKARKESLDESGNPRDAIEDALTKFRDLRAGLTRKTHPSKTLTEFKKEYPRHPIYHINGGDQENGIAGIEVGATFNNRAELALVGLHTPLQAGIQRKVVLSPDQKAQTIATSVVFSGKYEDDEDEGEAAWYTGEGGNDLHGRQTKAQELIGGNLALHNIVKKENLVRFTRKGPDGKYSYAGLYRVAEGKRNLGKSKFMVWRYRLERVRLPGQDPLPNFESSKSLERKN